MRRHFLTLCLLVPLISLAESSEARNDGAPPPPPPPFAMKSWVQVLLEHRQELSLTDAQVAGMERIQQSLEQKTAPVKQTLEQLRPPPPPPGMMGQGRGGPGPEGMRSGSRPEPGAMDEEHRARFEQVHSLMQQLRDSDDAAYQQAEALLNESQRQTARALISAEADAREKRRQEMHQRMQQRRGPNGGDL